jgi:hypothetical protein
MKKLLFCVIALALVVLASSGSVAASPDCPQSCIQAYQRCSDLCGGCPFDVNHSCTYYPSLGCYVLECSCRYDLC